MLKIQNLYGMYLLFTVKEVAGRGTENAKAHKPQLADGVRISVSS